MENQNQDYTLQFASFSGTDESGNPRALISYQSYPLNASEDSVEKQTVYELHNAYAELRLDRIYPRFIQMDLVFSSPDSIELKRMWSALQRYYQSWTNTPELNPIFTISLLRNKDVMEGIDHEMLHMGDLQKILSFRTINPQMAFLTREVPNQEVEDEVTIEGRMGGNIIRFLIPTDLFVIEETEEDISQAVTDAVTEYEDTQYINNYEENWQDE